MYLPMGGVPAHGGVYLPGVYRGGGGGVLNDPRDQELKSISSLNNIYCVLSPRHREGN